MFFIVSALLALGVVLALVLACEAGRASSWRRR